MHLRTHVRAEHRGRYTHGDSEYIDGMIEHDDIVGNLLKALDDMGIANNTIVVYTTDNGPHMNTWPDGAMTWFRSEKNTNWEGAFRVPCLVRWPGVIRPGTVTNEIDEPQRLGSDLCARSPASRTSSASSRRATRRTASDYKVHLDGYDQSQFLRNVSGTAANNNGVKSARDKFFYSDDDGLLVAYAQGRLQVRLRRTAHGTARWACGPSRSRSCGCRRSSTCSRIRSSVPTSRPTRSGIGSSTMSARSTVRWTRSSQFVATFKEFPPRSVPAELHAGHVMEDATRSRSRMPGREPHPGRCEEQHRPAYNAGRPFHSTRGACHADAANFVVSAVVRARCCRPSSARRSRKPIRCRPGTTARSKKAITDFVAG